jgi:hypothetical protein
LPSPNRRTFLQGTASALALTTAAAIPATAAAEAPAEITPALLAAYNSWLFMERRLLCCEMFPSNPELRRFAEGLVPVNTAADRFHLPLDRDWRDVPPPSTRAASILRALGIDWAADDGPHSEAGPSFTYGIIKCSAEDLRADAELIELGAEFEVAHARWEKAWRVMSDAQAEFREARDTLSERAREVVERTIKGLEEAEAEASLDVSDLSDAVLETTARTPAGFALQCRVFKTWAGSELWHQGGFPRPAASPNDQFIARLVDLVAACCAGGAVS